MKDKTISIRDPSHAEQIVRWAKYVKENPDKWKSKVKPLIDGQIIMAKRFYENLLKTPKGREKLMKLRGVKLF